jgi:hypothetical protein
LIGPGLLAVSAILLVAGAELFTENAAGPAGHLRLTLFGAAFLLPGAEPEELPAAVPLQPPSTAAADQVRGFHDCSCT